MTKYQLTYQDYISSLDEQLYFLETSLSKFGENEIEAKRISTVIRVLVHDTNNSTSLLKHLNKKDEMKFINSSSPNDGRLHSMTGMIGVRGVNAEQYFGLVAKLNENGMLISVPLFQQHLPEWIEKYSKISFQDWWSMEIIKIGGISLTRKQIILHVANKDGGAHIDDSLPEQYHKTKKSKLNLNIMGIDTDLERNVVFASVAQIGWELQSSIKLKNES